MEITFKGRHTSVPERFRRHASAKLAKLEKLDHNAIRIDVEVSTERNPRQADRSERVELTVRSRGPAIRAESGCVLDDCTHATGGKDKRKFTGEKWPGAADRLPGPQSKFLPVGREKHTRS